ncbi:MAG: methylmalonyl Co-A mutase-associated GTPase MeaB [Firmicutes bacterium]|nr:methylmalonyl Co-A mutase-associated GTPase MeaB [Candidatus Fermentithermobacillaceae bacterium]
MIRRGDRAALARAISLVEDGAPGSRELVRAAYRTPRNSRVIGITGAPGVGKSSLVDGIVDQLRSAGRSVAVIAVDPSSPFTGGAILGDRVRMKRRTTDPQVFFRSLASRGHLGGLTRATGDVLTLVGVAGFDDVLVETVGAGQSEVDVMKYASTVLVVLTPGLGDSVQTLKAGILEIGDVFVVNKADLPGADRTGAELEMMLDMRPQGGWRPPVIKTVATSGVGLDELARAIDAHYEYLKSSGNLKTRVRNRFLASIEDYLKREMVDKVLKAASTSGELERCLAALEAGEDDPASVASRLAARYLTAGPCSPLVRSEG